MQEQSAASLTSRLWNTTREILHETLETGWGLVKIMVPILIVTKILLELGFVNWIGQALSPVMGVVGLPGDMGLVWAAAIFINPYAAMVIYASLVPSTSLSIAQATVLGSMILIAHALPLELRIAQKAGMRISIQLLLRIGGGFLLGWILHYIYSAFHLLQMPATFLWVSTGGGESWLDWGLSQLESLAMIFVIILGLLTLMKILEYLRVLKLLKWLLSPLLTLLGMSKEAAPITIIGITLGLALGGGLVIQEAKSGRMGRREVFFSLALMCIFHSLIEDTLVMMLMGGSLTGLLWARLLFAIAVIFILVRIVNLMPDHTFTRLFYRPAS
jgi:hypothetical protein